ncbi:MAG: ATP-binding cassette domain-containing protein [Clostridia bacterium]|nr:ATP-binding cassette domain-containing protein [Clostridia bacterium]
MIEVKNLVKKYGDHTAVKGISFTVEPGKIYGLLGPNGAGKSTTMNIVTGCLAASEGSVSINGHDIFEEPKAAKKLIGYLPEQPPLYGDMTPEEYLIFVGEAKKVKGLALRRQVNEIMEITELTQVKDRLIANLSKGFKQRVGIAQAMLGNPEIIILDEPTVGLDPKQILEIRELIRRLGETKTVILSSHILAEISAVCDIVMIISHGNLVANDTIEHLEELANRSDKLDISVRGEKDSVVSIIEALPGVICCSDVLEDNGVTSLKIEIEKGKDLRDSIFFSMAEHHLPIISMHYETTTLEDIFLALTDDGISPDENGIMPTVEEILDGSYKKNLKASYENMSDEELSALAELEDTKEENEQNKEQDEDEQPGGDIEYTPLFGEKSNGGKEE